MREYRLVMIGFGNVGQGFARILRERGERLEKQFGARFTIVAVSDLVKGSLYDPAGLSPAVLLDTVKATGKLDDVPAPQHGWDALRTISESEADVVLELTNTDLKTGEPATTHLRRAIELGRHVITTNKGPVALAYPELKALADARHVQIGVEGTVMSGTPSLRLGYEMLAGAGVTRIQGIINGTTNYILTRMEAGVSYADALAEAQAKGYAEADPTGDVEGYDAAGKAVILSNLLMGTSLTLADVDRTGITHLTPKDISFARANDACWKLVAKVERVGGKVVASVRPTTLNVNHPLASVHGVTNALTITTELLGDVTILGPGAGRIETGYAVICDLLAIHRRLGG